MQTQYNLYYQTWLARALQGIITVVLVVIKQLAGIGLLILHHVCCISALFIEILCSQNKLSRDHEFISCDHEFVS